MSSFLRNHSRVILALSAGVLVGTGVTVLYYRMTSDLASQLATLIQTVNSLREEVESLKDQLSKKKRRGFFSVHASSGDEDDVYEEAYGGGSEYESFTDVNTDWVSANGSFASRNVDVYSDVDQLLDGTDSDKEEAYNLLTDKQPTDSNDSNHLWRYAKATFFMSEFAASQGLQERKKELMYAAKDLAFEAYELEDNDANIHKWCAITLGNLGEFEGTQEKIKNGFKFKQHIERAIELNPKDASAHYLLGRWCFGVYMLTWIERKVAATLFATPPTSTVDDALKYFLKADKLYGTAKWKENILFIAKCFVEKRDYTTAVTWLEKGSVMPNNSRDDRECQVEIDTLLRKYR